MGNSEDWSENPLTGNYTSAILLLYEKRATDSQGEATLRKVFEIKMRKVEGGSGNRVVSIWVDKGDAIYNDTSQEYEINGGYPTVANGQADRIAIQPGEMARRLTWGGASDFAKWGISDNPSEFGKLHPNKTYRVSELERMK